MTDRVGFDSLLEMLRCPETGESLQYESVRGGPSSNLPQGVLYTADKSRIYIVQDGVPVMLPRSIPPKFASLHRARLDELGLDTSLHICVPGSWSFSDQWESFDEMKVERTWGFSTAERLDMFFRETLRSPEEVAGMVVMDAGCGNGRLTESLGNVAKMVIGIDFSDSVFANARRCKTEGVFFIKGDLQRPPLAHGSVDIIVSNGVLHHTPSTRRAFEALAPTVAEGGSFYIWLYRHSGAGSLLRRGLRRLNVGLRGGVSKLPHAVQVPVVHTYTAALIAKLRLMRQPLEFSYEEFFIGVHDHLTPKYRAMHTPTEVAEWYFECGFGPIALTHWDNRYGFGVTAVKQPLDWTPGEHPYKPRGSVQRFGL